MQPGLIDRGAADGFDLFDVIAFLGRHAMSLALASIGAAAVLGVVSMSLPRMYRATVRLILPATSGPASAAGEVFHEKTLEIVTRSHSVAHELIEKHGLREAYGVRTTDEARRQFLDRLQTVAGAGVLEIKFSHQAPQQAADIANGVGEAMLRLLTKIQTSRASQRRQFLETRVSELGTALTKAEDQLRRKQETTGIIAPQRQAEATLSIAYTVLTTYFQKLAEARALQMTRAPGDRELAASAAYVAELRRQISVLQGQPRPAAGAEPAEATSTGSDIVPGSFLLPLAQVPEVSLEAKRDARQIQLLEQQYQQARQEYEKSRLQEVSDVQGLTMMDRATVPASPISPKMSLFVLGGWLLGLTLAMLRCYLRDAASALQSTEPERAARIRQIPRWMRMLLGVERTTADAEK